MLTLFEVMISEAVRLHNKSMHRLRVDANRETHVSQSFFA